MDEFESQFRNSTVINLIQNDKEALKAFAGALRAYRESHPGKMVITVTLTIAADMVDKLIQEAQLQP